MSFVSSISCAWPNAEITEARWFWTVSSSAVPGVVLEESGLTLDNPRS